ncbi:MAG: family 78 glycoside hydrolase catalytic domain [Lachnospiraceae bacterium]|nr:family 78 glycoside hydrolase catalytic domain [Lachnospiraceae bacterium]
MLTNARWIQAQSDCAGAVSFETSFVAKKAVRKATLQATAMGLYEPYINGQRVTMNRFMPGWTSYRHRVQVQTMDVTACIKQENRICLLCGNGWALGRIGWKGDDKHYASNKAVIACLTVEYEDGDREEIITDHRWSVFTSQIVASDLYDGETVDHCAEPEGLGAAVEVEMSTLLIPQEGEDIREQERIAPVRRFVTPAGETVLDFGQNLAGYVEIRVSGKRGERVVMRHAEILDKNGNFYTENMRSALTTNTYILSGDGVECFKPTFTWQGFRYIALDEFPEGALESAEFTAIVVHSEMKRTGRFVCGDEKINQLYHNLVWGQKGNFIDVPTDCPQRDERLGWTGDAQVFCQTAALNFDVRKFFKKWLKDLAIDQKEENGAVRGIAPVVMDRSITRISAAWGDAAVICPWVIYLTYGDKQVLVDQFDSMRGWIEYIRRIADGGEFLWLNGDHYGDWLAMDNGEGVYEGATDKDFIATAFYAYSTGLFVKAGKVIGRDMSEYEELYQSIVKAFAERFTSDGLPVCHTQTACAMMLYMELCEDRQKVADELAELVRENGCRLNTGFVGTPYLLYALSENGHTDLAYDLLFQEKFPSWLYSVNQGATTIWEHWDGVNDKGEMWSKAMNSFNHYAYGAVGEWLYRTAAGIRAVEDAPGFKRFELCPVPDKRLGFVDASIKTVNGEIRSAWFAQEGMVRYEFTVPENTEAIIKLPGGVENTVGGGRYVMIMK